MSETDTDNSGVDRVPYPLTPEWLAGVETDDRLIDRRFNGRI